MDTELLTLYVHCASGTYAMHSLPIAVNYAFEADAETRKQRRSSRMAFLFQSQGVLELAGQGKEKCTETQLKLLVVTLHFSISSQLSS
jgi:hypothetical protein